MKKLWFILFYIIFQLLSCSSSHKTKYDVVIIGSTPGGIMAGIAASRAGCDVLILERNKHIGGLPANGLGATDIHTRGATGGLFLEFAHRIYDYYLKTYGKDSEQLKSCSEGYHFEPHVAEMIFEQMLAEYPSIKVLRERQFDAQKFNVILEENKLSGIVVTNIIKNIKETYKAKVFIDATYEGDLAAAAGVPFKIGREGINEYNEPLAGSVYKHWGGEVGTGSSGEADSAIQAYNYRLCLTDNPDNRVPVPKPGNYNRDEYVSIIKDVKTGRTTNGAPQKKEGIWRIVNMVSLPNQKTDSNNQHLAFLSTDLPEENWPWPLADWDWRDKFANRLRDYTLGLLWFAQNDLELPENFRDENKKWGLAADEYKDNNNFPRQVYVREGRRLVGEYFFTAHDAIPVSGNARPPIHQNSITASHYAIDSHAVRKREAGRVHLDGFLSYRVQPYTVPYGVIVPTVVEGLLTPVPVSGTHLGFSTLRMEPCWMALGQAAGTAAAICVEKDILPRYVDINELQDRLLEQNAVLIYYKDVNRNHHCYKAVQYFGLQGIIPEWKVHPDKPLTEMEKEQLIRQAKIDLHGIALTKPITKGELLNILYNSIKK